MKSADEMAEECRVEAVRLYDAANELIQLSLILEGRHGITILDDPNYAARDDGDDGQLSWIERRAKEAA